MECHFIAIFSCGYEEPIVSIQLNKKLFTANQHAFKLFTTKLRRTKVM